MDSRESFKPSGIPKSRVLAKMKDGKVKFRGNEHKELSQSLGKMSSCAVNCKDEDSRQRKVLQEIPSLQCKVSEKNSKNFQKRSKSSEDIPKLSHVGKTANMSYRELKNQYQKVGEENQSMQRRVREIREEMDTMTDEIAALKEELNGSDQKLKETTESNVALKETVTSLEKQLSQLHFYLERKGIDVLSGEPVTWSPSCKSTERDIEIHLGLLQDKFKAMRAATEENIKETMGHVHRIQIQTEKWTENSRHLQ